MALIMASGTAHADEIVRLHRPNATEIKIITEIFNGDPYYRKCLNDPAYEDHFTWKQMNVAEINLDHAARPEIVTMIDGSGDLGNSGDMIKIWKWKDGQWEKIMGDGLIDAKHFYITDRIVNGYSVLRFPNSSYDRIFKGTGYTCSNCPD